MRKILALCLVLTACGKNSGGGKNDPEVGGKEGLKDSFYCSHEMKVEGKDGPDEVRGFKNSVTAFVYDSNSVAATMKSVFTFKDKTTFEETVSGVFAKDEKLKLESEFFVLKFERTKSSEAYPKFMLGESFEMDCK